MAEISYEFAKDLKRFPLEMHPPPQPRQKFCVVVTPHYGDYVYFRSTCQIIRMLMASYKSHVGGVGADAAGDQVKGSKCASGSKSDPLLSHSHRQHGPYRML